MAVVRDGRGYRLVEMVIVEMLVVETVKTVSVEMLVVETV
jgi:hypothetical protein